jgi:hypothetical protein
VDPPAVSAGEEPPKRQTGLWESPVAAAAGLDDDSLYEKLDIAEDLLEPAPMTGGAARSGNEEFTTMDLNDIESLDLEGSPEPGELLAPDQSRQQQDFSIEGMERDMLFTLEDPLDDLEPSISIRGNEDRNRR